MSNSVVDKKNILTCAFWGLVNEIVCKTQFHGFQISGASNIPKSGPFLLIANHVSRFDGLILMKIINGRKANYMAHPAELRGFQGFVLRSVGAFNADRSPETMDFIRRQLAKGEPIVMFPEGGIFMDGAVHPFKSGAARIMLMAAESGIEMPVIPVTINYTDNEVGRNVGVVVSSPVQLTAREACDVGSQPHFINQLTEELRAKVSRERERFQQPRIATETVERVG